MPAPMCSDARGNGSASRYGAIGATVKPPFPSKPEYLLGTRTECKNPVIYSRAADRDVPKSFNGSANARGGRLPNRLINGLVSCRHP